MLIDYVPSVFSKKSLPKMQGLSMQEKLDIFYTLEYPASTWFYHNVIGMGSQNGMQYQERLKFIKHLCENDLYYFSKFILLKDKLREKPNREMAENIMVRLQPKKQERKMLCEPRGIYKTTIASIAFPIWTICKNPDVSIQIDSETDNQAKSIYKAIKDTMEFNILLNEIWGSFREKDRTWNDSELVVGRRTNIRRDPTLYHTGVDSSFNGYHPDILVMDDPHSEQNTQNENQINAVDDHYKLLTPLVDKQGLILLICTRWVKDDLPGRIINRERDLWSVISIKSCYNPDGSLYADDVGLTHEFLDAAKKTMGIYRFSANYENDPKPDVDKSFKMEWLRYYQDTDLYHMENDEIVKKPLAVYMSVDASWSDKASTGRDPTAIIVAGVGREGDVYLLDCFNRRISPTEVVEKVFEMVRRWNPLAVASEDVSTQKGLNLQIDLEMVKQKVWFKLDRVKHQAISKANRILSLTPLFQNGDIKIREEYTDFIEQYRMFNPTHMIAHDDMLDALEMLIAEYRDYSHVDEGERSEALEENAYFDPVTGRC